MGVERACTYVAGGRDRACLTVKACSFRCVSHPERGCYSTMRMVCFYCPLLLFLKRLLFLSSLIL